MQSLFGGGNGIQSRAGALGASLEFYTRLFAIRFTSERGEVAMSRPSNNTHPIKPGAKLDPKGAELIKKMKDLRKQAHAQAGAGEHVGHIRLMPKNRPAGEHCSCSCCCC